MQKGWTSFSALAAANFASWALKMLAGLSVHEVSHVGLHGVTWGYS